MERTPSLERLAREIVTEARRAPSPRGVRHSAIMAWYSVATRLSHAERSALLAEIHRALNRL
ncbi:MAG TPA: hypothetical protein VN238_00960 [Solirubrobacteraceae bacterium]|nr:hypothetical protein [Solirubrobacteraceae bacterium]